jgi:Tfp pilus assembly protein PilF
MAEFSEILQQDHDYVDAWLGLADGYCWMAKVVLFDKPEERKEALDTAADCVRIADGLDPDSWHTHATRAFLCASLGKDDDARREFARALKSNRLMTEGHPAYLLFCIAHEDLAKGAFVQSRAFELMGNPATQAMHGLILERSGHPAEAEVHYKEALALNPNCGLCHQAFSHFLKRQGRLDEADVHGKRAEVLLDPDHYQLWVAFSEFHKGCP